MNESELKGPQRALQTRVALRSHVGRVRQENQDSGLVSEPGDWPDGRLVIVADGMGGHKGGATASRLAVTTIRSEFLAAKAADIPAALERAVRTANEVIHTESKRNPDLRNMGTTATVLALQGDSAWWAHVGDSRLYLLRDGRLQQITEDHSLVATMVREGLISADEAAVHPRRNVLNRSLGVAGEVEVDLGRQPMALREGDVFLLCSDGLHGFVPEDAIRDALLLGADDAAERCIELALAAGAPDNVTAAVCRIGDAPAP